MSKSFRLVLALLCSPVLLFAQVDTAFIYNTSMPYGTLDIRLKKSATRYYYLQEDTTFSFRESAPGVKTNTYRDMTSWDSSPYKQGNLRERNGSSSSFVMNYRLLQPVNYNPNYADGYPLIIMMHGAGERGNCWDTNCFFDTPSYNPNTNSPTAPTTVDHQLLNNDVNLVHGGQPHLTARNLAGSKLPNDPTLPARAFPGFVLFPQNLNGWATNPAQDAIRLIRLIIQKYNIDENRVYIHGLSNGGMGTYEVVKRAPWLFSACLPMSAISNAGIVTYGLTGEVGKLPLWIFQGGQDGNPTPSETFSTVKNFRAAGANVRYTLYPNLGHGVWNTAYNEPDFFSWMLSKRKTNPHISFGTPVICGTTQTGVQMGFSNGFLAYQWERDGEIISGEIYSEYTATIPGVYRARFSRKSTTPVEADWEPWSDPIVVTEINPGKPLVKVTGTTHLRGPGLISNAANNTVVLSAQENAELYYWYRNGTNINFANTDIDDTLSVATFITSSNANNGAYTLVTSNSNCPSPASDPVYLFFNNSAPTNILNINTLGVNFSGVVMSPSSVLLSWNDKISNESGYEIWRRTGGGEFKFVTKTAEDGISFLDTGLQPGTTYEYKLRAINNTGRSNYVPSDNVNTNFSITTSSDTDPPAAPQNLTTTGNTINSISLSWSPANDDGGIKEYYVYYNGDSISTGSANTSYILSGLNSNSIYRITVKAVDFFNRFSPASNRIVATTYVTGLSYKHSTGAWTDLDDPTIIATWTSPEFTGTINNFSLAPRTQDEFFNFEFSGYLNVPGGNYIFRISSDDGSRLFIDGVQIIDHDGLHGSSYKQSSTIPLTAGPHAIKVQFFEYSGGESLTVQYQGTGIGNGTTWTTIPDAALKSGTYIPAPTPATPVNLTATGTGMERIDLSWQPGGVQNVNGLKVVILGSSTAAGTGASPSSSSWVELFKSYFNGENVINRAVGGYDTRDIMPTGSPSPATPVTDRNITYAIAQNPNLIIINMPSNDVTNNISMAETMNNYRTIKTLADNAGIKMLVTTTQPRDIISGSTQTTSAQRLMLQQQSDSIRALFGNNVIDIYNELTNFADDRKIKSTYRYTDGIHVNNAGHNYIYTVARDKVIEFVQTIAGTPEYEIFRAEESAGNYNIVGKTTNTSFVDSVGLYPGKVFYYKTRALSSGGTSDYSVIASDTTWGDSIAPTIPTNLVLLSKTYTNISFNWTASTDNIAVTGYEIFANGELIGTSTVRSFTASNLEPNSVYSLTVKARDAFGNRSAQSDALVVTTNAAILYYSDASGNLNAVSTWKENINGTGNSPASFSTNGQYFVVSNRSTTSLGGAWNIGGLVSKVIVPDNVTLTVDNPFSAKVEVLGTGRVDLNHETAPTLLTLSPTSTVSFNGYSSIPRNTYGNVVISGSDGKMFESDTTTILGNLTISDGVALKGSAGNSTILNLYGDFTYSGAPALTASDNRVNLLFAKNGTQNFSLSGDQYIQNIKTGNNTTVNVTNTGTPATIHLGSLQGGGINLPAGSTLSLGNNNLTLQQAATINSNNENGRLAINGGNITISSSSSLNSNLYFEPANNSIKRLQVNLSGSGDVIVREAAKVSDALKISRGELQSNGNLTLLSTATLTANIEEIENGGSITGDVSVQRYFNPKGRIWRYISTPVAQTSIADLQAYIPITGSFTGSSTGPGLSSTPSMYDYDGATQTWIAFPPTGTSNQEQLEKGKGYSIFMRNTTNPITLQVAGNPYQGNVAFDLAGGSGNGADDGWNLLGNPYASTIAWNNNTEAWIKSGINPVVSVRDNPSGQFRYYDASSGVGDLTAGKIAPGQAFWVQAITGIPSLIVTEKAKNIEQQIFYREKQDNEYIVVNLKQNTKIDPTYIIFSSDATDGFDSWADGTKRKNETLFNLSTLADSIVNLALNHVSDNFCSKTIQLNITSAPTGSYQLTFENLESLKSISEIHLRDNFTKATTILNSDQAYAFNVTSDTLSSGATRFSLTFVRPSVNLNSTVSVSPVCDPASQKITIHNTQPGVEYFVLNNLDEPVSEPVTATGSDLQIEIPQSRLQSGTNDLNVLAGFKGCDKQIVTSVSITRSARPVVNTPGDISICQGSDLVLHASGGAEGAYKWYDKSGVEISGANGSALSLQEVRSETAYFVASVDGNGCESERAPIHIFTESLEIPVIILVNDSLFTNANAFYQWKKDGQIIEGATSYFHKPLFSGVYTIQAFMGGCSKESEPFEYLVTGAEGVTYTDFSVDVFPVPAQAENIKVRIGSVHSDPVQIELYDLVGKPLYHRTVSGAETSTTIKIEPSQHLSDGIYIIKAVQRGKVLKKKIIVRN